jgi:2-polyprenyl-6-methoxyphenol hydroxylase-like FAD-dependent oxidoreductase
MGQGANQGLEDIFQLSRLLNDKDLDLDTVFKRYQALRLEETTKWYKDSREEGYFMTVADAKTCAVRDDVYQNIVWSREAVIERYESFNTKPVGFDKIEFGGI